MTINKGLTRHDFWHLVVSDTPLIDVRAPIEYAKASVPNSVNLPIMDDHERHVVGTTYKEEGSDQAISLGLSLVSGLNKTKRLDAWTAFLIQHPQASLMCFRGGMRSQFAQAWLQEEKGLTTSRLEGGYKALRTFLLSALDPGQQTYVPIRLGGLTGCGKTRLLVKLNNHIDLEGLANHRGSSFGGHQSPQPTQASFENALAYQLIKLKDQGAPYVLLENESRLIGKTTLPQALYSFWRSGPLLELTASLEERVHETWSEYVLDDQTKFVGIDTANGLMKWADTIRHNLSRIQKKLGVVHYQSILSCFEDALSYQVQTGDQVSHKEWVKMLLTGYYDPMYKYFSTKNQVVPLYRGDHIAIQAWLEDEKNMTDLLQKTQHPTKATRPRGDL